MDKKKCLFEYIKRKVIVLKNILNTTISMILLYSILRQIKMYMPNNVYINIIVFESIYFDYFRIIMIFSYEYGFKIYIPLIIYF